MEKLKETKVKIEGNLLDKAGEEIKKVFPGQNYVLISDENVWPIYGERLLSGLEAAGFRGLKIILKPGEASKSLETFGRVCEQMAAANVGRDWLMIALGGGVVGDLAGFVAAVFKRGMEIVQIPTSLVAQVDSSLGGKTAVNLDRGKNLVGTFHQPALVLTDPELLKTLGDRLLAEGMAEVVKYGAILDGDFFTKLEEIFGAQALPDGAALSGFYDHMEEIVDVCSKGKLEIVAKDEKDKGDRRKLNFGHSFGHGIEKMGGYRVYSHGEAVAMGMCLAAEVGESLGLTEKSTSERIEKILVRLGLTTALPPEIKDNLTELVKAMEGDKKNEGGKLNIILLEEIGSSFVHSIESNELLAILKQLYGSKSPMEIDKIPHGLVNIPPSKSYMHRATIMAALAGGLDLLTNTEPYSDDTLATLNCMKALTEEGFKKDAGAGSKTGPVLLDVKESGASLRFILPMALALGKVVEIKTKGRLLERPQEVYYEALRNAGAIIHQEGNSLFVSGELRPGKFILPGDVSSQYISGLLMALPLLEGDSLIKLTGLLESAPYVEMTIDLMRHFGIEVKLEKAEIGNEYTVKGGQKYQAKAYQVEGDYSAAANFLVAGALGCQVECLGLKKDSLQGDKMILEFLKEAGAQVRIKDNGNIEVRPGELKGIVADISQCPDLAPPLAVLLNFCKGESRITGAGRLAMKESNRLESISRAINDLGGDVRVEGASLMIKGQETIKGGRANPAKDHRIAMAIALASVKSRGRVFLEDPDCVSKSYPDFFKDFCRVERNIEGNE